MRKVILSVGLAFGIVAWGVGLWGLLSTPDPHVVPVPNAVTAFGACAMFGTATILVIVFAHGARAGDVD